MAIAVVVPCTASKHVPPQDLRLGAVVGRVKSIDGRFRLWQAARSSAGKVSSLRNLYAGPRWRASLRIATAAQSSGKQAEVFVASAGLGLLPIDRTAPSYSATFSRGDRDSVVPAGRSAGEHREGTREWWNLLTYRRESLQGLAQSFERVVVVLSPDYLNAVTDDLVAAVESHSSRILVFATGTPAHRSLRPVWVRVRRGLRETTEDRPVPLINALDATLLQSTAALIVSKEFSEWSSADQVQNFLDNHAAPDEITNEGLARAMRRSSTDEEVHEFVRTQLQSAERSATALLRLWREQEQRRCEERRFKRIYASVVAERSLHG